MGSRRNISIYMHAFPNVSGWAAADLFVSLGSGWQESVSRVGDDFKTLKSFVFGTTIVSLVLWFVGDVRIPHDGMVYKRVLPLAKGYVESWLYIVLDKENYLSKEEFETYMDQVSAQCPHTKFFFVCSNTCRGEKNAITAEEIRAYCENLKFKIVEVIDVQKTALALEDFQEHIITSLQKAHPELFSNMPTDVATPAPIVAPTSDQTSSPTLVNLDELRVVILGDPAVGKSSLVIALSDSEKTWLKKNLGKIGSKPLLSTDGIDSSSLELSGNDLKLNLWDFAGQELYLVSHQFFLGERSLYLILFDARQTPLSQSRLAFWIRSLHARVPFADVILIGTHIDDARCAPTFLKKQKKELDDLVQVLKTNHPIRVHGIFWMDTKHSNPATEINRLKEVVSKVAKEEIPNLLQKVDATFLAFREELMRNAETIKQENKPPLMLWSDIMQLGKEKFGLSEKTTANFLQFLQAQGRVIFHRPKDVSQQASTSTPPPYTTTSTTSSSYAATSTSASTTIVPLLPHSVHQFDNIVILDASWFNKTVLAAVITSRHKFVKEGKITKQDLANFVWREISESLSKQFIFLLERYEVLFLCDDTVEGGEVTGDMSQTLLVPSQLENGGPSPNIWSPKPGANEPEEANWLLQLQFVPEGLFSRIIARIHQLRIKQKAWRTCTLLNRDNHRALIRLEPPQDDTSPSVLRITVRGVQPDNLVDILVQVVEQLIARWYTGLDPSAHVLCSQCSSLQGDTLCTFDIDHQLIPALANVPSSDLVCNHSMMTLSPIRLATPLLSVLLNRISRFQSSLGAIDSQDNIYSKAMTSLQKIQDTKRNSLQVQSLNIPSEGALQEILAHLREIREEQHRAWARQIKFHLDMVQKQCPVLFMLVPEANDGVAHAVFNSLKTDPKAATEKLLKNTFRLHLLCEHSVKTESGLQWHTIPSHGGYTIENLRKFVAKIAPFATALLQGIKPLLSLAKLSPVKLPDISSGIDFAAQLLRNPLEAFPLMEILISNVRENGETTTSSADLSPAALREWVQFLSEKDPKSNFAGLEQVAVLATGEVRWLCPTHAAVFKTHYSF